MEQGDLTFLPVEESTCTPGLLALAAIPTIEEDFLLALRFLYYVKAHSAVPDNLYDRAEKELLSRAQPDILMQPGSDCADDYPDRIEALAIYIRLARHDYHKQHPTL